MDRLDPSKRIGLLGGSFNPAHDGHLYISQQALTLLQLDEIWWILSPHNPLKDKRTLWPYEERRESVLAMTEAHANIHLSEVESTIGSQYTADSLSYLKNTHPQHHFVWLMGEDNLYSFHRWHQWQHIASLLPIAVLARKVEIEPNYQEGLLSPTFKQTQISAKGATQLAEMPAPHWVFLPIEHHPLSSTSIRKNDGDGFISD